VPATPEYSSNPDVQMIEAREIITPKRKAIELEAPWSAGYGDRRIVKAQRPRPLPRPPSTIAGSKPTAAAKSDSLNDMMSNFSIVNWDPLSTMSAAQMIKEADLPEEAGSFVGNSDKFVGIVNEAMASASYYTSKALCGGKAQLSRLESAVFVEEAKCKRLIANTKDQLETGKSQAEHFRKLANDQDKANKLLELDLEAQQNDMTSEIGRAKAYVVVAGNYPSRYHSSPTSLTYKDPPI